MGPVPLTELDREHLRRCVELAQEALAAGDAPFGSVLAAEDGTRLHEDRNRVVSTGDPTAHPEIALARWAAAHLLHEERARATVFTSGEHCPMCSAAHGWAGLGRIAYVCSAQQLASWTAQWGLPAAPVRSIPVRDVAPGVVVEGPVPELVERVRDLHRRSAERA